MAKRVPPREWQYPFVRLYGAVSSGRMACPKCATLIVFKAKYGLHGSDYHPRYPGDPTRKARTRTFNPVTGVLRCPGCGRSFQLGLLLWDLASGAAKRPMDQRPTIKESAQLRAFAQGFWLAAQGKRPEDPVNRYIDEVCTCPPLPWRRDCPIHGSEGEEPDQNP